MRMKHSVISGKTLPDISLPNKDGILLKLNRNDTFRLVIFFYSLTGNPKKNYQLIGIKYLAQKDVLLKIYLLEIIMKNLSN